MVLIVEKVLTEPGVKFGRFKGWVPIEDCAGPLPYAPVMPPATLPGNTGGGGGRVPVAVTNVRSAFVATLKLIQE